MRLRGHLYRFLLNNYFFLKRIKLADSIRSKIIFPVFEASIRIHGRKAILPSTYLYPFICRDVPSFNNPYLQLVYEVHSVKTRKLNIIDVGAAIGDTFLLIEQNISEAISQIYCIEGHAGFLPYLAKNLTPKGILINQILSSCTERVPSLIQLHPTTASNQGSDVFMSKSIDEVWQEKIRVEVDIIKIDTDGFDGRIIAGAKALLKENKPCIIFEFHFWHLLDTGNSPFEAFEILSQHSYKTLLWYDKFGTFSHLSAVNDLKLVEHCIKEIKLKGRQEDIHFDVVAIPENLTVNLTSLKKCNFAKHKIYPY